MNRELPHWKPSPGLLQCLRHFNSLWLLNTILQGLFFWLLLLWSHKRVLRQSFFFLISIRKEHSLSIYIRGKFSSLFYLFLPNSITIHSQGKITQEQGCRRLLRRYSNLLFCFYFIFHSKEIFLFY